MVHACSKRRGPGSMRWRDLVPQRARRQAVNTALLSESCCKLTARTAPAPAAMRRDSQMLKLPSRLSAGASVRSVGAASAAARPARQVSPRCALQWWVTEQGRTGWRPGSGAYRGATCWQQSGRARGNTRGLPVLLGQVLDDEAQRPLRQLGSEQLHGGAENKEPSKGFGEGPCCALLACPRIRLEHPTTCRSCN